MLKTKSDIPREGDYLKFPYRLLQAQKLETIGALAAGVAHDLNNILATISGYSEMLLDDLRESSSLSEKVIRILDAVSKASSVTNQILSLCSDGENEKIPVRISEVLKESIGFLKSSIPVNIRMRTRISEKEAYVFADPSKLFRVFLNLIINAIQSMEIEGGTLSVYLEFVEGKLVRHELNRKIAADEYAFLTFNDTGKGIDPSIAARIFEPFVSARTGGRGTGMGLSIVHGIVTEMKGEILVSGKKKKGCIFYVYLPVLK